jgi:hypothetical protein
MRTKITICILLLSMFGCTPIAGCRMAWTDHGMFIGILTDFKGQDSSLLCDPNKLEIKAGNVSSETDSIAVEVDPVSRVLRLVTD